jgi:hypothetical protein
MRCVQHGLPMVHGETANPAKNGQPNPQNPSKRSWQQLFSTAEHAPAAACSASFLAMAACCSMTRRVSGPTSGEGREGAEGRGCRGREGGTTGQMTTQPRSQQGDRKNTAPERAGHEYEGETGGVEAGGGMSAGAGCRQCSAVRGPANSNTWEAIIFKAGKGGEWGRKAGEAGLGQPRSPTHASS